jgi:two-component system alkaline phosphatase synthesis response regulator PhoP
MKSRILLVEDEPGLRRTLSDLLTAENYDVVQARDGIAGLDTALEQRFDLILLDVMLPGRSGFEVCREIRQHGIDTGILMLTAKTQVVDRVVGLRIGADDYLTKPFDPMELLARIEALLRRLQKQSRTPVLRFQFGSVHVDFEKPEVLKNGVPIDLAGKELQLLRHLIDHRDKVLSREDILQEVWQYQPDVSTRTVDVHIAWLRQKLEENPQFPRYIITVRGTGYRFSS